jgi:replicative DNA helicase
MTEVNQIPPHNPTAERQTLAFALGSPATRSELSARGITAETFHLPANRLLWAEIGKQQNIPGMNGDTGVVVLALQARLLSEGKLDALGGPSKLLEIHEWVPPWTPTSDDCDHVAGLLREPWMRRQAIAHAERLIYAASTPGLRENFEEALALAAVGLGKVQSPGSMSKMVTGRQAIESFLSDIDAAAQVGGSERCPDAVRTGIREIDERIGGLIPYLWVIGAPTSEGKTVLAVQLALSAVYAEKRALIFPLEMSARQLIRRILASRAKVPMSRLNQTAKLSIDDTLRLTSDGVNWPAENLIINEDQDVTIQDVRSIARATHARSPLGCIVVDYIQLASAGRFRQSANREQEVAFIAAECSKMATELRCPVIAPTQLNRSGKARESDAIAFHSAVYLVIEPEQVNADGSVRRMASIFCAKNRDGERNWRMPLKLTGDIQTFEYLQP